MSHKTSLFNNYIAKKSDLNAISTALNFLHHEKLSFIFAKPAKIAKTLVISFDSKNIFVWSKKNKGYFLHTIAHNLKIKDEYCRGWGAYIYPEDIIEFLPKKWQVDWYKVPKISGGLLTLFLKLQKNIKRPYNPYITYESYLATIIHEFAHVYYYKTIPRSVLSQFSELFAFCAEYAAASIFWPNHKKSIDKFCIKFQKELTKIEQQREILTPEPLIAKDNHNLAIIQAKALLKKYPLTWPRIILKTSRHYQKICKIQ